MIALRPPYPCVMGGPVLNAGGSRDLYFALFHRIAWIAASAAMPAAIMAWTSISDNAARLKALPQDFHDRIGAPVSEWFAGDAVADP